MKSGEEEKKTTKTTTGGRSDTTVPRGIEVLVKKAAVDEEFRGMLMAQRGAAAAAIGLELDPAESAMLSAISEEHLARIIRQTVVPQEQRRVFLGHMAAAMLAVLGVGLAMTEREAKGERVIKSEIPDLPPQPSTRRFYGAGGGGGMGFQRPTQPAPSMLRSTFKSSFDGTTLIRDLDELTATGSRHLTLTMSDDGKCMLVAFVNGERVFDGPCNTEAQRAKVPAELWMALRMAYYRDQLGMEIGTEWSVISAKIERVVDLQEQLRIGFESDPRLAATTTGRDDALGRAADALAKGLTSPVPTNDADLKIQMTNLRDARKKMQDDLASAQKALQSVVSIRQEANLIRLGILP